MRVGLEHDRGGSAADLREAYRISAEITDEQIDTARAAAIDARAEAA